MRQALSDLITNTIIYEYSLPDKGKNIEQVHLSTVPDECFSVCDTSKLVEIIYNAILDYSYDEFNLKPEAYQGLLFAALKTKLKFNKNASQITKIKYGFYGEVLLYCILCKKYNTNCLISRGYFYNPLENEETKGYDAYHIIENVENKALELWFGEVKFHIKHETAIASVMKNIDKALSDSYLEKNLLAMINHKDKINFDNNKIKEILNKWSLNPEIKLIDELKNNNMKLIYPVYLIYDKNNCNYDDCIKNAIKYIKDNYETINANLSIPYQVFFIFMPIEDVKKVKEDTIQWIEEKKPVLS